MEARGQVYTPEDEDWRAMKKARREKAEREKKAAADAEANIVKRGTPPLPPPPAVIST